MTVDLVIRDASLDGTADTVDVGVDDGRIVELADAVDDRGDAEIDAGGDFVSPGFVDCHVHLDRADAATGERLPKGWEESRSVASFNALFDDYYADVSIDEVERRAVRAIQRAVANGTTHIRSHVAVDHPAVTTDTMAACLRAVERTDHLADVQLVAMAAHGILNGDGERLVREAVEMALDDGGPGAVLVGGADPATRNNDIERTIDTWLDVAEAYDVGVDPHLQDGGTLGAYTMERLMAKAAERGYEGRVTASHAFALAHLPEWWIEEFIGAAKEFGLGLVTCYSSTRPSMPVRALLEGGVTLGHGTDNDRDFVSLHGHCDTLEAAMVQTNKLHGDGTFDRDYRWTQTNGGLALLWEMITERGADVLGLDRYGVAEGKAADLVVFDEPSPQWAVMRGATRTHVVKGGRVVARDGELLPEHRVVEG